MADRGIAVRHRLRCRSLEGGACNCEPAYQVNVYSARDGRRLWKTCATRAEARAWQVDAKQGIRKGTLRAPSAVTLREAAEEWLDGGRSGVIRTRGGRRFKPSVLRSYERALNLRILPEFGGAKLGSITHIDLQHFVDRLRVTPVDPKRPELGTLDPSTIRNTIVPLRSIFRHALRRGRIAVNPTAGLELPAVEGRRDRIASPGEASQLLDALAAWPSTTNDVPLWATALYAGLRRGELQALQETDIDLEQGVIHVRRSWDDKEGAIETKSRAGTRTVPIAAVLRGHLLAHHLRRGRPAAGLVFGRSLMQPFSPPSVRLRALSAWRNAKPEPLQPIGLHECRHTFASLMIAAGVNAKALSTYLGHSSIQITLDRYGHLMPGNEQEAARLLDRYLGERERRGS
jgi:integrase